MLVQLSARERRRGVVVRHECECYMYSAESPPGRVFEGEGHELVAHYEPHITAAMRAEVLAEFAERLAACVVVPCTAPGCEWCLGEGAP